MTITFTVPGAAKGKGRPRFARAGNFVRTYTPEETARRENLVALLYRQVAPGVPPHDGPVALEIHADYLLPASWPKKKRDAMDGQPKTSKPDVDNVGKLVLDGLNGIAWTDDALVADCVVRKRWGRSDEMRISITRHGKET